MKHLFVAATVLVVVAAYKSVAAAQLPLAAEPILTKAANAIKQNHAKFTQSNAKPLQEATKDLKELVSTLNKQGDAKGAAAVQNLLAEQKLQVELFRRVGAQGVPQNSITALLVGHWTHPNGTLVYQFSPSGEFSENHKQGGAANATGAWQVTGPEEVTVSLSNQHTFVIRMAGNDRLAVLTWGPDRKLAGDGLVLDRIK